MPLVNQLVHNALWSMKDNFLDVPTDCPQRDERCGWTGDAQIFCRTATYLMDVYPFYRKWLEDVRADQTPEGGVSHVVPDIITPFAGTQTDWLLSQGTHSAAAWADAVVICPWTLYLAYGDAQILEENYDAMRRWIEFMRAHAVDCIWNYKLQFGDWVALDAEPGSYFGATPNDLTCTAYYAYSTGLFARIARILDRDADAVEYGALYDEIVDRFQRTFFTPEGGHDRADPDRPHPGAALPPGAAGAPRAYSQDVAATAGEGKRSPGDWLHGHALLYTHAGG